MTTIAAIMKLVIVEWEDAAGGNRTGWRPTSEIKKRSAPEPAVSVGWLLRWDDSVVICPHLVGTNRDEGDGEIAIPSAWVKTVYELKQSKKVTKL